MIVKVLFDKDIIEKVIGTRNVDVLFLKYSLKERKAYYKTSVEQTYKLISFEKVMNI